MSLLRSLILLVLLSLLTLAGSAPTSAAGRWQTDGNPTPVLAYYYIWFDPGSWDRAKRDLPLLGAYSSDDVDVMRQHIRWAKSAGIDGFIVSWKATDQLNPRLASLAAIAEQESFWLIIIYQGLDFERRPLPVDQILSDLAYFDETYGQHPAFQLFGRPTVIWSGTWEFSNEEISQVAGAYGEPFDLIASEQQVDAFSEIAHLVDGNAYYWSSADPLSTPGYEAKLQAMAEAVHKHGGLWIAPAAPGFDARLIGGARVIERRGGETLRAAVDAARASSPDAIGLISWNEFSENSHIEPSQNFDDQSLIVLADLLSGTLPDLPDFDSSEPADTLAAPELGRLAPLAFLALILGGSLALIAGRRGRP